MKKQHGLKDKELDNLFEETAKRGLDRKDLDSVGKLINSGMSVKSSLDDLREHAICTINVVLKHSDIMKAMQTHGVINRQHLFKKIFYGELPPLPKPYFVFTGIIIQKEQKNIKEIDHKKYEEMFNELIQHNLSENQLLAIQTIKNTPVKEWTEGYCLQIEKMLNGFN